MSANLSLSKSDAFNCSLIGPVDYKYPAGRSCRSLCIGGAGLTGCLVREQMALCIYMLPLLRKVRPTYTCSVDDRSMIRCTVMNSHVISVPTSMSNMWPSGQRRTCVRVRGRFHLGGKIVQTLLQQCMLQHFLAPESISHIFSVHVSA